MFLRKGILGWRCTAMIMSRELLKKDLNSFFPSTEGKKNGRFPKILYFIELRIRTAISLMSLLLKSKRKQLKPLIEKSCRIKARLHKNKNVHAFDKIFSISVFLETSRQFQKIIWWIEDYVEAEKNNDEDYCPFWILWINYQSVLWICRSSSCQFVDQKKMKKYCQLFSVIS